MARQKIKLQDQTPARVVFFDDAATVGATIGVDLKYQGKVLSVAELKALFASGSGGVTAHRLLSGLELGDDHPQYVRRDILTADGDMFTRNAGIIVRLGIGSTGQALRVSGGLPTWQDPTGNPTAQVGLTAINGTSLNYMRADGAPALNVGISPTWTGTHTFSITPVVPNSSWTYAKIQNVSATQRILGRTTAGAGVIEELTAAQVITLIGASGAALTKTDDTNVTLTLGGTPASALLKATSLTLGWTSTLAATRGGTGLGVFVIGDVLYASSTSALSRLGIGSTNQVLTVISGVPSWQPAAGATFANPTASVGLTAVNGVATTAMRSDAAPALSQAISPTWTGSHRFNGAGNRSVASVGMSLGTVSSLAIVSWADSAPTTNNRLWEAYTSGGSFFIQATNDALTVAHNAMAFARSGTTISSVTLGNTVDYPALVFNGAAVLDAGLSGAVAGAELNIHRAGSTANAVVQGPSIGLTDTTAVTGSVYQHAGGYSEWWQYNGSWIRRAFINPSGDWGFRGSAKFGNNVANGGTAGWVGGGIEFDYVAADAAYVTSFNRTSGLFEAVHLRASRYDVDFGGGTALSLTGATIGNTGVLTAAVQMVNAPATSVNIARWLPITIGGNNYVIPLMSA